MRKQTGMLALAAALIVAMPASAQQPPHPGKPAPGKPAAARPAAPHPAPHAAAPHVSAPRMPAPHVASPRVAPAHVASPHVAPQRLAVPHTAGPSAVNRTVQRHQFQQERALRHQRTNPTAQAPTVQAQKSVQATKQPQVDTRQQLRAERSLRRSEDRELRRLPVSQRAQRREEIRNARQQRALGRQQLAQPNALQAQTKAQTVRGNRRNGAARVTQDAARQGRFASRFAARRANGLNAGNQFAQVAARHAWRDHHRAHFVPWYGPVFWPYAYSDVFDYTFWPYGYDDGYWAYAYDDFFDGLFWGESGPPADYAYAAPSVTGSVPRPSYASVQELCKQPGTGVTAWPFADIERKVGLNADQKQLLGDVRKASEDAGAVFKASCPQDNAFPLTPPGRLSAMTARLDATLQAVETVRPALVAFYNSLSDEQKERFNELGPKNTATNAEASEASKSADACKDPKQGLSNLPIEKIEDALNPTDAQETELNKLQDATNKAVSILQAACPDETPITPPGRLEAMEKRLQAMTDAAKTVKPALENFYASLTGEQKARFNRIGQQLSRTN
jgi:LTXXQ motif family protein